MIHILYHTFIRHFQFNYPKQKRQVRNKTWFHLYLFNQYYHSPHSKGKPPHCYLVPILLVIPIPFAITIRKVSDSPTETLGLWTLTDFGNTLFFKVYSVCTLFLESILPLILLISLNTIVHTRFKKLMAKKSKALQKQSQKKAEKANNTFTRLIITLTFICIVSRTFDTSIDVFVRAKIFFHFPLSDELYAMAYFIRYVAIFVLLTSHALDGLLYYFFDRNFRALFSRNQVQKSSANTSNKLKWEDVK